MYFNKISNSFPAQEIHEDSCGKAKTMRPRSEWFPHEEAHREPAESVVYFRSDGIDSNMYLPLFSANNNFFFWIMIVTAFFIIFKHKQK